MSRKLRLIFAYSLLVILFTIFIVGTFYDYNISSVFIKCHDKNYYGLFFEIWGKATFSIPLMVFIVVLVNYLIYTKKIKINNIFKYSIYSVFAILIGIVLYLNSYIEPAIKQKTINVDELSLIFTSISFITYLLIFAFIIKYYEGKKQAFENHEYKLRDLIMMIVFIIAISLTVQIMKEIFARSRMIQILNNGNTYRRWYEIKYIQGDNGKSFPSGHTAAALTMLTILFVINKNSKQYIIMTGLSWLIIFLVAFSRVTYLKHFTTDVTASCLIAFGYFFLFDYIRKKDSFWLIFKSKKEREKKNV